MNCNCMPKLINASIFHLKLDSFYTFVLEFGKNNKQYKNPAFLSEDVVGVDASWVWRWGSECIVAFVPHSSGTQVSYSGTDTYHNYPRPSQSEDFQ